MIPRASRAGPATAPLAVNSNANIDGFISDQFTWIDSVAINDVRRQFDETR